MVLGSPTATEATGRPQTCAALNRGSVGWAPTDPCVLFLGVLRRILDLLTSLLHLLPDFLDCFVDLLASAFRRALFLSQADDPTTRTLIANAAQMQLPTLVMRFSSF